MDPRTENKIILVTRLTRLEELIKRFNTLEQAKFYIEHMGADFNDYQEEHNQYYKSVKQVSESINKFGRAQQIDRYFLPNFLFDKNDLIVVVGQDGLVVNTAKYLQDNLIIAINPDPKRWDGILLPFTPVDIEKIIPEVFLNKRNIKSATMAKANLNDGQVLYAVNDLFIGPKSHTSARYQIEISGCKENHSSSGIIVSTGVGSTGWFKSIIAGATSIVNNITNSAINLDKQLSITWEAEQLYFSVREPFPTNITSANLVFGVIDRINTLKITSFMPENGVIFSDGIENDFLNFNSGAIAEIQVADKKVNIII